MAIIVATFALVVGIAFFQIVQGLFSSLIMTILTILSAAFAFAYYEPLAEAIFYNKFSAYADAVCLIALFVAVLLVLRIVFDMTVRGNVLLGVWADRIGGGALGLITGMVAVGVLLVGLQMLPYGPSVLTYRPFDDSLQRVRRCAPFYPDDFAVGLARLLSAGPLSGRRAFGDACPHLLRDLYCARNTAGKGGRIDTPTDALGVGGVYEPPTGGAPIREDDVPNNPLLARTELDRIVIVSATVKSSAANEEDDWWRLPATHFRLVTNESQHHYPVAYLTYGAADEKGIRREEGWQVHPAKLVDGQTQVGQLIVERPAKGVDALTVDWVYRLPRQQWPVQLVFRRVAAADIDKRKITNTMPPTDGALSRRWERTRDGR